MRDFPVPELWTTEIAFGIDWVRVHQLYCVKIFEMRDKVFGGISDKLGVVRRFQTYWVNPSERS